ncbi:hypothetical protein AMK59_1688 [Oryctes borbonicus]|uniref:SERTA domain-containing protein n=1 Tax=Oryctes borbonicus TaxID=1629725 RepID=A0A0T6BGJ5_9SCAR|nr:hypothetical protein AMK59_1688 [Oryctes borbonicus]
MKSPPTVTDDCDDIFGPPRTHATGYYPPKNRPSMISAKYRQKEERRKVLKISINKLKKIEDPEASLCRSVLINNTMKRLQKEARDEKIQKQQLNYPRCYDNDNFLNLKNEFIKNEMKNSTFEESRDFTPSDAKIVDSLNADFAMENEFDNKIEDISGVNDSVKSMVMSGLVEENLTNGFATAPTTNNNIVNTIETVDASRKRPFDEMEDCDVQDVLSQFYMPPTPRMLTCIDDDEDVNVVDDEPVPKRARTTPTPIPTSTDLNLVCSTQMDHSHHHHHLSHHQLNALQQVSDLVSSATRLDNISERMCDKDDFRMNTFMNNNLPETESRLRYVPSTQNLESEANPFSCGHASMFSEMQNTVFHSLIASLET